MQEPRNHGEVRGLVVAAGPCSLLDKLRLRAGGKGLRVLEAEESTYPCRTAFSAATAEHFGACCRAKNAQGT